ncbi:MAG: class I SAM-dependent methyltransferase [Bacteroidota bacterium]
MSVLLKKPLFEGISQKALVQQLESKKKAKDKLPTWFNTERIYYPPKLHIEQSSSELTADYKAGLVDGKNLVDVTGGFGVDSYSFSKKMSSVIHCEINSELSEIVQHNFNRLKVENIKCHALDGLVFLKESSSQFDWIFIDPSRRNDRKGKVFLLKDCEPNVPNVLAELFAASKNVLVKVSPLLDISQTVNELNHVKEIHVVAVDNEVKEILFLLNANFKGETDYYAVNLYKGKKDIFKFRAKEEKDVQTDLGMPHTFLYEPNAAILKSAAFKSIGNRYGLKKLEKHSHLYTSEQLIEFPGSRFKIKSTVPYSKSTMTSFKAVKANVTTRNFNSSVAEIRKKYKIQDGGKDYLFFTKTLDNKYKVLICEKIASE